MSPAKKGARPIVGLAVEDDELLSPDELELLEDVLGDEGLEIRELLELSDELNDLQRAILESHWVQIVGAVELGQVSKAHDHARDLAKLLERWNG